VEGVENVLVRMFQSSMKYEENSGDYWFYQINSFGQNSKN
jgi:hypothetical protein